MKMVFCLTSSEILSICVHKLIFVTTEVPMNTLKIKLIVIAILSCICGWLVTRPRPTEAQGPNRILFIRGFVAASLTNIADTPGEKSKDIALPNAKVFLVRSRAERCRQLTCAADEF